MSDETQQSPAGEATNTPKRPRRSPAKKNLSSEQSEASSPQDNTPAKATQAKSPRPRVQKSKAEPADTPENAPKATKSRAASSATQDVDKGAAAPKPRTRRTSTTKKSTAVERISAPSADSVDTTSAEISAPKATRKSTAATPDTPTAATGKSRSTKAPAGARSAKAATATKPAPDAAAVQTAPSDMQAAPSTLLSSAPTSMSDTTISAQPAPQQQPEPSAAHRAERPELRRQEREQANPKQARAEQVNPEQIHTEQVHPEQAYAGQANAEQPADSDSDAPLTAIEQDGEAPARKSRRGRRGGRGRSRSKAREALAANGDSADGVDGEGQPIDTIQAQAADTPQPDDSSTQSGTRGRASTRSGAPSGTQTRERNDGRASTNASAKAPARAQVKSPSKTVGQDTEEPQNLEKAGRRKMFISVVPGEQVEVALVEEGAIHEYYLEMLHQAKTKGNIYKGVIHNIDTNLQAAFVNYGTNKNGFLQIDEVHPEYYLTHHEAMKGKKFPPMQKVLKAGQEVLVQVVKEPSGSKGAFLTTWLSLAGRFLVLTPGQEQIGVSRKVENDEERARLREMMNGIDPGEGLGAIVRTVSAGTSKTTLKNDLQYLKRVWKDIRKRGTTEPTPSLIYQEPGLAERAVRDYLTDDVCEVWVDDAPEAEALRETVALLFPRKGDLVKVHNDLRQTLWERFNIQRQLEQIYSREVILPSGGRLVFDQTEALMAIDINSGKISGKGNFEAMALKTNVEAAECIARQLKLRDIGGQIVIDFIEMRDKNHIRDVEKTLRTAMKNDRARHDVGRMSSFGLLEIVRQRTASSALAITMEPCPVCGGTGLRRNIEWQALQIMREIARLARVCTTGPCQIELATELGLYLLNHKRDRLREMEKQYNVPIEIKIRP